MKKGTLLFLIVLAGATYLLWQKKQEDVQSGGPELPQYPLFPQLAKDKIKSVRIDNVERGVQVKLERDSFGSWFLTDPIAYPAVSSLVRTLLREVELSLGIAETELREGDIELDPPRIVLELVQADPDGDRTLRLEIGGLDLDPSRIFVRIPGHGSGGDAGIFRTLRTLYTTLDRNSDDYRDRHATHLRAHQVTAFKRRGEVFLEDQGRRIDLRFEAQLDQNWMRTDGLRVALNSDAIMLLIRGAAELKVELFHDDAPRDYSRWGLDPPAMTVELRDEDGEPTTLHFGHLPIDAEDTPAERLTWTCRREGFEHVWGVSSKLVQLLARPVEELLDYQLVRAFRREMVRLELEREGKRLLLAREGRAKRAVWQVSESPLDEVTSESLRYTANAAAVEDALALLEHVQLGNYPGLEGVTYGAGDDELRFAVQTVSGLRFSGSLGVSHRERESAAVGRLFLRDGDQLCGWIGEEMIELCGTPLDAFRSLRIFGFGEQSLEAELRQVELTRESETLVYLNDGKNRWTAQGTRTQAPAVFVSALDRGLLSLKARRWLEPDPRGERRDPREVRIEIRTSYGGTLGFSLGRDSGGLSYCRTAEGQLAEVDAACFEELLKLFGN
ncbi:MAG: hypothetical protein CMJ89_16170 [Planctomycetes bacterium]|nr:hypothetical protein [Planctomycetota bacterium]